METSVSTNTARLRTTYEGTSVDDYVATENDRYRQHRIRIPLQLTQAYVVIPEQHTEGKISALLNIAISCAPLGVKG